MKSKRNLRPQVTPKLKQRFSLWYVAGGVAVVLLVGIGLFIYLNLAPTPEAVADTQSTLQAGDPTGPGGVGGTKGDSHLQLWLNGDSLNVVDGLITNWYDQSGYEHHFTQTDVAKRPLYQNASAILNHQPVLDFQGNGQHLADEDGEDYVKGKSAFTILLVTKSDLISIDRGIFSAQNPNATDDAFSLRYDKDGHSGGGTNLIKAGTGVNQKVSAIESSSAIQTTAPQIISYSWLSSQVPQLLINGTVNTLASSTIVSGTIAQADRFLIGIGAKESTTWDGRIAETVYFDRKLNSAERIIVENYLAAKYGLALTSEDFYQMDNNAKGDYDYGVAGIGRVNASNLHTDAQGSGIVRINNALNLEDNEFLFWGHNNQSLSFLEPTDVPTPVKNRMDRVWGVSEQGDVGAVDMVFDLSALDPVKADDLRLLVDTNNDGSLADETEASGGVMGGAIDLGNGRYQFSGVTALQNERRFTLGSTDPGITTLPVELLYFRAKVTDMHTVRLEWKTASEINNDFFTVERSTDGTNWEAVDKIKGAGNATQEKWYTGFDQQPPPGTSYFRLKQTDFDGKFTYSEVVAVEIQPNKLPLVDVQPLTVRTVAPNPFEHSFYVEFELNQAGTVHLQLIGLTGRAVSSVTVEGQRGENRYEFTNLDNLQSGTYLVRMVFGQASGTVRVMKQ